MKNFCLLFAIWSFCGHMLYFVDIYYFLWLFGIFFKFWYVVPRQIWQPCLMIGLTLSCVRSKTSQKK
jgi:hypothetical protein